MSISPTPVIERILRRCIQNENDCWIFDGKKTGNGYGVIRVSNGNNQLCHRVTYPYFVADIPAELELDHLCRNRSCCNPWHLEPVTRSVNLRRSPLVGHRRVQPTHCPEGHPYDAANTSFNRQGGRSCKRCMTKGIS